MPFKATADGSVSGGTCSLTEACHAGPNSAMPQPTTKQNASRMFGVTKLSQAITASEVAPTSEIDSDTSATMRRSYMSAMAPAGIEISMIGSIKAVCTSATLSADGVICVIAQAAPTPWLNSPRFESRLASPMRRNTACRSAAATLSEENRDRFAGSVIIPFRYVGAAPASIPADLPTDGRETPRLSSAGTLQATSLIECLDGAGVADDYITATPFRPCRRIARPR